MAKARNAVFAEEKAEVEVLYAQTQKHADIAKKLIALQSRLQGGGRSVQESIGPIHDNTKEFSTVGNNIDKILAHVDKMLEPGQDKSKEESIIRAGPSRTGLNEYMASLKRLQRARSQMSSSNMKVQQQNIGDTSELLNEGSSNLQSYFQDIVADHVQPVEPLNFITKDAPFPTIPKDKTSQLAAIESIVSSLSSMPRDAPTIHIYSDLRSTYLASSLQSMSIACMTTSKRKHADEVYRQGTCAIGTYAGSMEGIFVAEYQNISAIFHRDFWGPIFDITCRKAMTEFAKTIRELNQYIKSNIMTDCFLAYEILEIVNNTSYRLSQDTHDLKLPFTDALKPIRETAKASLPELIDDQRRRIGSMQALPADGAPIPYTKETMSRLQTMTAYPRTLASLLASIGEGNWNSSSNIAQSSPSLDVGADGNALQIQYTLDTIEAHLLSLEARAKALHKSKAVLGVFISNTVALIDRMIHSGDLGSMFATHGAAQAKIDNWRKRGISTYLDAWKEPCSALFDVQYTNRPTGNRPASGASMPSADIIKSLSSRDKDAIKEKFKHFNTSFDECVRRHREMMGAMEREVKTGLGREVGNMVEPLYSRFWDRYEALDRGRGKYVKWDKAALAALLASLE